MGSITYNLEKRPESKKGYSLGARTTPRFLPPVKVLMTSLKTTCVQYNVLGNITLALRVCVAYLRTKLHWDALRSIYKTGKAYQISYQIISNINIYAYQNQ